jgi:hypothetical protein
MASSPSTHSLQIALVTTLLREGYILTYDEEAAEYTIQDPTDHSNSHKYFHLLLGLVAEIRRSEGKPVPGD